MVKTNLTTFSEHKKYMSVFYETIDKDKSESSCYSTNVMKMKEIKNPKHQSHRHKFTLDMSMLKKNISDKGVNLSDRNIEVTKSPKLKKGL